MLDCVELHLEHVVSVPGLPLLELLAHADDGGDALILAPLQLLRDDLVSLQEVLASLAVAHEGPVHTEVLHLLSLDLARLRTLVSRGNVLHAHVDVRVQHGLGRGHVQHHGKDDHLCLLLVVLHLVQGVVDDVAHELDRPVALPVATHQITLLFHFIFLN